MPLTDVKIRQAKPGEKPIKLADGNGLYLEVRPNGSKLWRYRYKIAGKENTFAVGDYPTVSLQDARRAREDARALVKLGQHPSHVRQSTKDTQHGDNANTFKVVAEEWIASSKARWTPYYLLQIRRGMDSDVYPHIGRRPIRSLTSRDMLEVLERVVSRGAPTVAINIRTWCSAVFRYAIPKLKAESDPVAALKGVIVRPVVSNAEPMMPNNLGLFLGRLDSYQGMRTTTLAVRLMLYTFVRTVELRRGEWSEISWDAEHWIIPGGKMKKRRTHIVPLSTQSMAILRELFQITGGGRFMFPNSRRPDDIMSCTTINRALENLGVPFSGHDFRATASTHLYEMGWDERFVEMQLAHVETNKVKAAYNHAKYLAERRIMMQQWADWIDAIPIPPDLQHKH